MSISFIIGKYLSLLHAGSQYALFEVHKKTDAFESGLDKGVFKTSCKSCMPTWYIFVRIDSGAQLSLPLSNIQLSVRKSHKRQQDWLCVLVTFYCTFTWKTPKGSQERRRPTQTRNMIKMWLCDKLGTRFVCFARQFVQSGSAWQTAKQLEVCKVCSSLFCWREPPEAHRGQKVWNNESENPPVLHLCWMWCYFCRHQPESEKLQVTRWLLTHSLQRWAVLCEAHAGEQLHQHDGSISEKIREEADGGARHYSRLNWSDLDSCIADFLGYTMCKYTQIHTFLTPTSTFAVTLYVWLWSRSNHECCFGSALQRLRVDLRCGGDHLHLSRRSLFSRVHRCHPDITGAP